MNTLLCSLRERALELPFLAVSETVRLTERQLAQLPRLNGLAFKQLEDVPHITAVFSREELYAKTLDVDRCRREAQDVYEVIRVPPDVASVAYGFGIGVARGSEPASLGAVQLTLASGQVSPWYWHCCCKTQYASAYGDENLVRSHRALATLLDSAQAAGFELVVRDETGYWESRDERQLIEAVQRMNQLIARFAGTFTDAVRNAGYDSSGIQGEIFRHPDFERLEMGPEKKDA